MSKIGIFGGSFNPPHLGHIQAARAFQQALAPDLLLLIPSAQPPHKPLAPASPDAETRLALTKIAAQTLKNTEVSDIELRRNGPSYTVDTITALRERFPNDELLLLIGTDMLLTFSAWCRPQELARQVTLAVVSRFSDDRELLRRAAAQLTQSMQAKVILLENQVLPISSTSVRAMLAFQCAQTYLDAQVLREITARRLYHTGQSLRTLPFEELSAVSLSLHKPQRVAHVIGCSQTARLLAAQYGADEDDASRAGILHDVTKALTPQEQLKLCENYAIITNTFELENPKLLHAVTAAAVARNVFGENEAVCEAIRWHTTGRADMSLLEKIIYLADYIEPNRDFDGLEMLREKARSSLDEAMLCGLEMTYQQLQQRGKAVDPCSLAALRFLKEGA